MSEVITGDQLAKFISEQYPAAKDESYWRGDSDPWLAYVEHMVDFAKTERGLRLDDNQLAVFRESLEHVLAESINKRYPALRAREFIPINTSASPGAQSIHVIGYEGMGTATRLATYGEDVRTVDVRAARQPIPVVASAAGWLWTIQQMRAMAQAQGKGFAEDVNQAGLDHARLVVATDIDGLLATGEADSGVQGFTNLTGVGIVVGTTGAWAGGVTTPAQILADIMLGINQIEATEVWMPDTFLIPILEYNHLAVTEISAGSGISILNWLRAQLEGITIQKWAPLATAGAGGVTRGILYQRDRAVVEGYIPVDIEALPPYQQSPFAYLNVFHARCAGCHSAAPNGMVYLDGI